MSLILTYVLNGYPPLIMSVHVSKITWLMFTSCWHLSISETSLPIYYYINPENQNIFHIIEMYTNFPAYHFGERFLQFSTITQNNFKKNLIYRCLC